MKVALVHDYIKEYGGAERVLEALHEIWPDAPVFTSVYLPRYLGPHKERFKEWDIRTSFFQQIPFKAKLISPFRLLSPFIFKSFDFSKFDVVIVSATGAYFPNMIRTKPHPDPLLIPSNQVRLGQTRQEGKGEKGAIHICYCHTPPRYLYGYATAREWKKNRLVRVLGETANHFLRMVDFKAGQNPDFFIANSEEVLGRIQKFYRREATVIYPPVEVQGTGSRVQGSGEERRPIPYNLNPKPYFLAGGRLARSKGIDVIVDTFQKLDKPLKIFGRGFGGFEGELREKARKRKGAQANLEFLGEVSDEEKLQLMAGAKAFVFASPDEDFGITPVEAMGVGTPVIAYYGGGVKETVVDGKTGVFYHEFSSNSLQDAVSRFEKLSISKDACIKQAQKFSKERFQKEIKAFVEDCLKK